MLGKLVSSALIACAAFGVTLLTGCQTPATQVAATATDRRGEPLHIPVASARQQSVIDGSSQYISTTHEYSSGTVRVLRWSEGMGPVVRYRAEPGRLFVLEGSVTALIGQREISLAAGDAAILPEGTLRNASPVGDTVILEFLFDGDPAAKSPVFLEGSAVPWADIAQWRDGDGKPVSTRDPDAIASAPAGAARLSIRNYRLNGVAVRQAVLKAGSETVPGIAQSDVLLYVVRGRMRRFEGDHDFLVSAGDTIREAKGDSGYWKVLEDSEVVATDAPP